MPYTQDLIEEMNVLIRYNLANGQEGLQVHKSADPAVIAAFARLHGKGLLTDEDGGYLTDLGREAAEHVQSALTMLAAN
ncbi:TIGR02647 family protein [Methylogaea oryzae]|uniref:DNA-binding protein n=1 Tax=Methylogaea oryzae TaxID=1295382 RepID=A0A8D4VPS3_9GAMM|nr:TIGR02647 family protein [Methylogaea oryzae]BBL71467.1 DNA-binding protein [Methylogaea oryzae]